MPVRKWAFSAEIDEQIERVSTEHDEMHWRLIRLGHLAKCDVWVPRNDQAKQFQGYQFRDFVLREFHHTLNVPRSVENIDVVWKFGRYSIKSAFEIEHSTSIYSGILRLSDLRAEPPNSNYPLFIVTSENGRKKVFDELKRPTFPGPCLRLHEVIRFLGYDKVRELDNSSKNAKELDTMIVGVILVEHDVRTRAVRRNDVSVVAEGEYFLIVAVLPPGRWCCELDDGVSIRGVDGWTRLDTRSSGWVTCVCVFSEATPAIKATTKTAAMKLATSAISIALPLAGLIC